MHLIIDNYGAQLEIEEGMFRIKLANEERMISPLKLSSINILKPSLVSTAALLTASRNQIPVLIYNTTGDVEAWVWSPAYANIATLRRSQLLYTDSDSGLKWVAELLKQKADLQISNLKWLANRISAKASRIQITIDTMLKFEAQNNPLTPELIRAKEGYLSKLYWNILGECMQPYTQFKGREQQGAVQPFNLYLNYAYGILYGMVESSLLMTGLDPYTGILHIDRYNRPALAFDHIEPFRPWIDKMLLELFISKKIGDEDVRTATPEEQEESGYAKVLLKKKELIDTFFALMDEKAQLLHKRYKRIDHIHYLSRQLVNEIKNYDTETHYLRHRKR